MSNMPDVITTLDSEQKCRGAFQAVDPFRSLRVHFGMLVGVDEFEALDAYHRGKMWLHSAWLHRQGVVWGLGVPPVDLESGEIKVFPGLALDGLGRELHLESEACLNVGEWFAVNREEPLVAEAVEEVDDNTVRFDAHVTIRFHGCLTRPVPAISEPCEDAGGSSVAYSRVFETVELRLEPGLAPAQGSEERPVPYHRLRLLFALEDPILGEGGDPVESDQEVLDARDQILGLPTDQQPAAYLQAFRRFAALDEIDLSPALEEDGETSGLFPQAAPAPIPLANIPGLTLESQTSGEGDDAETVWSLVDSGEVDVTVRPSHVATSTIQELINGPLFAGVAGNGNGGGGGGNGLEEEAPVEEGGGEGGAEDAGGPRIDPESVAVEANKIIAGVQGNLHPASVKASAFSVSAFDESGWRSLGIKNVRFAKTKSQLTIDLTGQEWPGSLLRLQAFGTGSLPLDNTDLVPLAGAVGGPPASAHEGRDFVFMTSRD